MAQSKPSLADIRSLLLPETPMAPISSPVLPLGEDWGYQLKWDGVRMLARIHNADHIELFSRSLLPKNQVFPEIVHMLQLLAPQLGRCLLDGEVVWWNGARADFQQVLKRERARGTHQTDKNKTVAPLLSFIHLPGTKHATTFSTVKAQNENQTAAMPYSGTLIFVLFDLLSLGDEDLRSLPYEQRHRKLMELIPADHNRIFVTDLFKDGNALWSWVEDHSWEGVVSKRLSSPYREGKKHSDWFKKKTALLIDVDIVGFKWRSGRIASLIMAYNRSYFGSVSLGLTDELRRALAAAFPPTSSLNRNTAPEASPASSPTIACPFPSLPSDLKREHVQWLPHSFGCRVTGLQITDAGQLRHPKLVTFLPKETTS